MAKAFDKQVIIITGAASGIGRATAIKLGQAGASLALVDINEAGLEETASQCGTESIITARIDVSTFNTCQLFVDETARYFSGGAQEGAIHHVFNCAGVNPTASPLTEVPNGYFEKLMDVNVKGVYNMTKAAIPFMRRPAVGDRNFSFVNVSSVLGLKPGREVAIYCATKWAVIGFSKSMALELGPQGIRVNVVAPGFIDTPSNINVILGENSVKEAASKVSMGKFGTPEEVADVVVFLMSKEARYMNGSVVEVNGGMDY